MQSPPPAPQRRFYSDGRGIWYIDRLWPLVEGLPHEEFPIASVRQLDEVSWFSETWGRLPTCRAVMEHCRRMMNADLTYPIILGPGDYVLDGVHRVCKALLEGRTTLPAVRLRELPPPDEVLSPGDPRYEAPGSDA